MKLFLLKILYLNLTSRTHQTRWEKAREGNTILVLLFLFFIFFLLKRENLILFLNFLCHLNNCILHWARQSKKKKNLGRGGVGGVDFNFWVVKMFSWLHRKMFTNLHTPNLVNISAQIIMKMVCTIHSCYSTSFILDYYVSSLTKSLVLPTNLNWLVFNLISRLIAHYMSMHELVSP